MLTAFPSLVFAAKKPATKTINYKAAAYGGVRFRMKYFLTIFLLVGCATTKTPLPILGKWEFDERLTYQSLYDLNGGLKPIESIDGDLYIGTRYEFHFNRKYFDFDAMKLVLIGYLDNGEYETKKTVPINIVNQTFDYVVVSYVTYWGENRVEKIFKTEGCLYIKNEDHFREYYCGVADKI